MFTRSLTRTISIAFITLCSHSAFAETITVQEADLLTKEDIASTQVLIDVCPAFTANNPALKTKIDFLTNTLLKNLSQTTTLAQLQQDGEYQAAFKEAQANAKEVDSEEQKSVCADVLTLES